LLLQSNADLPAWAVLSSAALGGIAYWLAIFPVDVIKSSMQTDSIIKGQRKYTDIITSAKVSGPPGRGLGLQVLPSRCKEISGSTPAGAS